MTLLDLLSEDRITMKRAASTGGGEYHGPCPFCGGKDRFVVNPNKGNTGGRYWCRGCGESGDAIQYLRDKRGLSYRDACHALKIEPKTGGGDLPRTLEPAWTPKNCNPPAAQWRESAQRIVNQAAACLFDGTPKSTAALKWLHDRGLNDRTITPLGVGYNPTDRYLDRQSWGLPPEVSARTGKPKKLWIPEGILIPTYRAGTGGNPVRLRVRKPNREGGGYVIVSGSDSSPMAIDNQTTVYVVVESELDALLIWQEAKDLVGVIALGSVSMRPDSETHYKLCNAKLVLNALDYDRAGGKESHGWWRGRYPNVKRWMVPESKDPGDYRRAGGDIRQWIEAGL